MWLVFANENENCYKAGIQKSLKVFEIKIYSIQSAIQKFWYTSGMQTKKTYKIVYRPFFAVRSLVGKVGDSHKMSVLLVNVQKMHLCWTHIT